MRTWKIVLGASILTAAMAGEALLAAPSNETELERLARRLSELEIRNADLERQMERRSAELEKYRSGLEQAIAELNRVREQRGAARSVSQRSSGDARQRSSFEVANQRLLSSPRTRLDGREVTVSGEVLNHHRESLRGVLIIELLRDGMPIDELRMRFEIPAQGRLPYAETFVLTGYAAGRYSARVGFAY